MSRFFICYSRKVRDEVTKLSHELELLGHSGWFDQKLAGGQAWWNEILAKIHSCDFFIVALAPDTLDSQAACREWNYASQLNKTILPVLLTEGVSEKLLPPVLTRIQYVDYRKADREAAFALVKAIHNLPDSGAPPAELPELPEVPVSYLVSIKEEVESSGNLNRDQQNAIVLRLQEGAETREDLSDIRAILHRFKQRDDLPAKTDKRIDDLIARLKQEGSETTGDPLDRPGDPEPVVENLRRARDLPTLPPGPQMTYAEGKNPIAALILSLFIPGVGQFYNGDMKKGALMLAGAIIGGSLTLGLLWIAAAIWSAVDAYQVADGNTPLWI